MESRELTVVGAFEFTPRVHKDSRGEFLESFRFEPLAEAVGGSPVWLQTNVSASARGVFRGIHYSVASPGQAKYVTVVAGSGLDYLVDLRPGSPTYRKWDVVRLDASARRAVFVPVGVGHAFLSLEDNTVMHYLCAAVYDPATEYVVHPFDSELALEIPLPRDQIILSDKDASAGTLRDAVAADRLLAYAPGRFV